MSKSKNNKIESESNDAGEDKPDEVIDNSSDEVIAVSSDDVTVHYNKTGKRGFGLFIAVLFSLAALGASGYLWLTLNSQSQQMASTISSLESSLKTITENQSKARQQLQKSIERQILEKQTLKKSMARMFTRVENTQQTWSVEEIHQLLQLATDQLNLAGNIDGAIKALSIADRRIAEGGDPDLQPVRKQIASDIANLQQIARIDMAGTINRLSAVEQAIDQLPTGNQTQNAVQPVTPNSSSESTSLWQQLGQDMSGLVRIRRIDKPEVPLLPPEQSYFLRENSKALIFSTRLALLRKDTAVYRNNLQQAGDLIGRYFDNSSQKTQWILSEITNLAALDPAPPLPDINGSLSSLQGVTEGKQK